MTAISPTIRRMSLEEACQAGLQNRGLVLEHQGKSYQLHAGLSDKIHVFEQSIYIYVLTINMPLGYIGFDAYLKNEQHPINTIFLHSEYQFTDYLGLKWKQLSPATIAKRLSNYLI